MLRGSRHGRRRPAKEWARAMQPTTMARGPWRNTATRRTVMRHRSASRGYQDRRLEDPASMALARQGGITKAGHTHARRALVEGAWAYRYPAKVSRHLQLRLEKLPAEVQAIGWKAQVRLCKRYRQLMARGKHANQVVVAIAREMAAFAWAIARIVPLAA